MTNVVQFYKQHENQNKCTSVKLTDGETKCFLNSKEFATFFSSICLNYTVLSAK